MNLTDYFDPVSIEKPSSYYLKPNNEFGYNIYVHTPDGPINNIEDYDLAILGVLEDRNSPNIGCAKAPDQVRQHLYKLYKFSKNLKIIDLGNLKQTKTPQDTYFGLRDVLIELLSQNVIPIIIGGSQDLVYSAMLAYAKLQRLINLVTVDSRLDLKSKKNDFNSLNFLKRIFNELIKYLFNYSNIGHQIYFTDQNDLELIKNLFFDSYRLGDVKSNIKEMEPVTRDADFVSIDFGSVKHADAPGNYQPSPNGFNGEEICQLARYSGLSDNLSMFMINEINPEFDLNNQTSHLAAQAIWYFIDGYSQRKVEKPDDSENFMKYIVNHDSIGHDLVFYKSEETSRWWLEIPSIKKKKYLISCSYDDYLLAGNQEIPNKWWRTYQKIN